MLFDTHAHIDSYEFPGEYKTVIRHSLEEGVWLANIGTTKRTSQEAVRIADEFSEGVYAAVGLHPDLSIESYAKNEIMLDAEAEFDYEFYKRLAQHPKVVGIGECGLDYFRKENRDQGEVKRLQQASLIAQIRLANELDKALVIHCRASNKHSFDAYEDLLQILAEHRPNRFVVHGFTASVQLASRFVEAGGIIALNGIATFDKTGLLKEVMQQCPIENIVLETDAPYLAPVPFRGAKNEPRHVMHVARRIAEEKGIDFDEVAAATTANALRLYRLAAPGS